MVSRLLILACGTLGLLMFYIATIGLVPALARHAQDGSLQRLKSIPAVFKVMQAYEWPASFLARVPVARSLFELSADFWCAVTSAPETT